MKIFDCFMYFDEDILLDIRLNILWDKVDYFVIVESKYNHKGEPRDLNFDIKKFNKFKSKIIYIIHDLIPENIEKVLNKDDEGTKSKKEIFNAYKRENSQRNYIEKGLSKAGRDDIIMISDLDEIPNLKNVNLKNLKEKIILFKQKMFYYKLNLQASNINWVGTKVCKKKFLKSPQWLRDIKDRKYDFYRLDTYFSQNKYIDVKIIENGGWHFTNLKTPEQIKLKLASYLHHREFDINPLTTNEISQIIERKKAIYNLSVDKKNQKFGEGETLNKVDLEKLPDYIIYNKEKFGEWLD